MTDLERELLKQIQTRAFKRGKFTLASGESSDYYIDGKMIEVYSESAYLIGQVIHDRLSDLEIASIGGLEVGAVPLTTAAVIAYHTRGKKMEGFWVRDKVKDHGTKKLVEGYAPKGARLAVVEDVVTTGSSSVKAIEAVREIGCEVACVVTIVDRLRGGAERFKELGITDYRPIFTIRDLGVEPKSLQGASH
jgi:orotate phosphoribosyltransferase